MLMCWCVAYSSPCPDTCLLLQWPQLLNKGLKEVDPELYDIIEHEKNRQYKVRTG